jgi:hypothetical protein
MKPTLHLGMLMIPKNLSKTTLSIKVDKLLQGLELPVEVDPIQL